MIRRAPEFSTNHLAEAQRAMTSYCKRIAKIEGSDITGVLVHFAVLSRQKHV